MRDLRNKESPSQVTCCKQQSLAANNKPTCAGLEGMAEGTMSYSNGYARSLAL
jgi:hypothetical protein